MPVETMMTSDATSWPAVGNPPPPVSDDPNPEWEMIAEDEEVNTASPSHVMILPDSSPSGGAGNLGALKGRPRSHTIGGEAAAAETSKAATGLPKSCNRSATATSDKASTTSSFSGSRRTFRRCASTPDLLISDNAHERIVEDESDSETDEDSNNNCGENAVGLGDSAELSESFEVLSDKNQGTEEDNGGSGDDDDEPVMIDEESNAEESGTLVSNPSVGTSSWTMAGSSVAPATTSVWGMKKSPSFADMVAKNLDSDGKCEFEKTKAATEAKLRDSHRRHHLRVRTKPKFVVSDDSSKSAAGGGMMKHAHSTGDLTKMLHAVEEGHESSGRRTSRRVKKQLSAMMEEEDESADFVIGRGNGTSSSGGGGGGDVLGETDAMDYYHRKELGSKSTSNKKKERPDEAKRKEISMHKKEMQRKKQQAAQAGKNNNDESTSGGKKKKKNEKGFGGKKERRRL